MEWHRMVVFFRYNQRCVKIKGYTSYFVLEILTEGMISKTGKSIEVKIPFTRLIPTKFARTAPQSTPFDSSHVTALQLTLSKFEYDGGLNPKFQEVQQEVCYF
jgi:hypothetical protein